MIIITHEVDGVWTRFSGTPQLDAYKVARLVEDGAWNGYDLRRHGLRAADPFVVPEGRVAVGEERFANEGRQQVFDTQDAPPPPRRMVPKWLVVARLTDAQLEQALGMMSLRQQERWRAAAFPAVYADDPEMLAILGAVGADAEQVLRDGEEI